MLSGTPKRGGQTFTLTVKVTDSASAMATKDFTLPIGPASSPIAAPSWLQVGLSYMPFSDYNFTTPASSKFPNSCPSGSSVRSCFQTVLRDLRDQGVSGIRIFVSLCDPDLTSGNTVSLINAMLSAAAQTTPTPLTVFELDFEQELNIMDFPALARFIVDNAQTDSGQPNVRDALRYYMGLHGFDPGG